MYIKTDIYNVGALAGQIDDLGSRTRKYSGYNLHSINLTNSYLEGSGDTGGLIGYGTNTALDTHIMDSYAAHNHIYSSKEHVGGLAGYLDAGIISGSYVLGGQLEAEQNIGSIVGRLYRSVIKDTYARLSGLTLFWDGTSAPRIGGMVGEFYDSSSASVINTSYVVLPRVDYSRARDITVNYDALGIVRSYPPMISSSYWQEGTLFQPGSPQSNSMLLNHNMFPAAGVSAGQLQQPTAATGIFANWGATNSTCMDGSPAWDFGTTEQYPALTCPPGGAARQR